MTHAMSAEAAQQGYPYPGFRLDFIESLIGRKAAEAAFAAFGDPSPPGGPRTLDYAGTWKMMVAHVQTVDDESHGAAQPPPPVGNFEMMCEALVQGRTLAEGFARMARFSRVMQTDILIDAKLVRDRLYVAGVSRSAPTLSRETYTDAFALLMHCVVRWMLSVPAKVSRAQSSRWLAPHPGATLGLVAPTIQWRDEGFLLVYDPAAAAAPFRQTAAAGWLEGAYREFLKLLSEQPSGIAGGTAGGPVAERVRARLIDGRLSQPEVARTLGMSVATLRRRLAEEGRSFRSVAMGLKRDAAEMLLATERSTQDIASDLGLSDSRCLRRACQTWFGNSPSEVRDALRATLAETAGESRLDPVS